MTARASPQALHAPLSVVAVQDLDCIDRAKFVYTLPVPVPPAFLDQFADARIVVHAFSRFSPCARDLFSIVKAGRFRCDGIVDGDRLTVTFEGDPLDWPVALIDDFDRRLRAVGLATIDHVRGATVDCAACPARFAKQCRGASAHGPS